MRFLRTIRFDAADPQVFPLAAEPGEWAVSGAFAFSDRDQSTILGKDRQAFRAGFLGTASFGWSSLVVVSKIAQAEREAVIQALTHHLLDHYQAPDRAAARAFAENEAAFAASLCERPVNTIIVVERSFGPHGIGERFRAVELKDDASPESNEREG